MCFSNAIAASRGGEFAYPEVNYENSSTKVVTEETYATYLMANYDTEMFDYYIRDNFGVRVVDTDLSSIGFRNSFDVVTDKNGVLSLVTGDSLERVEVGCSYTEVLPSFSLVLDYADDILLRAGTYRGMSRADPCDMG